MNQAWMKWVLWAAAVYNIAWGAWVVLFPNAIFDLADLPLPSYPQIWQCVGMIVGCYGIGYAVAATDPVRWWAIVMVGLIGKVFGPIGFLNATLAGDFPGSFIWVIIFNDLIWWVPFAGILWAAARGASDQAPALSVDEALRTATTQNGESLHELSMKQPALVVCLRHLGCTFCREALHDLASRRNHLESQGTAIVLVHMSDDTDAARFFKAYDLEDVPRISDPDRVLYRAFGLHRGTFKQLFSPIVWWRGISAAFLQRHLIGKLEGDGFQMPGVFLIHGGRLAKTFRHHTVSDRPDYEDLAACPVLSPDH